MGSSILTAWGLRTVGLINRININPNDYYNPVIDYYNLFLRFEPCHNLLRLILILCKINININTFLDSFALIKINCPVSPVLRLQFVHISQHSRELYLDYNRD